LLLLALQEPSGRAGPGEAANRGLFPLAEVGLNAPFWVWVDAELAAETRFCSVGPFTCELGGFVLKAWPKAFSLREVLLVQHFSNGGAAFAWVHFQFKK